MSDAKKFMRDIGTSVEYSPEYYLLSADQGRIFRKVAEAIGAVAAMVMGVQFILKGYYPFDFLYLPMKVAAPAEFWGLAMFAIGLTRGIVLTVNGWWPLSYQSRKLLSIGFIFVVWLPLASCFWWSFFDDIYRAELKTYPGLAYSVFTLGIEFLILHAHASYVYAVKERYKNG